MWAKEEKEHEEVKKCNQKKIGLRVRMMLNVKANMSSK